MKNINNKQFNVNKQQNNYTVIIVLCGFVTVECAEHCVTTSTLELYASCPLLFGAGNQHDETVSCLKLRGGDHSEKFSQQNFKYFWTYSVWFTFKFTPKQIENRTMCFKNADTWFIEKIYKR